MSNVIFLSPEHLDWHASRLRNFSGLTNKVQLQLATKPTTQEGRFNRDIFWLNPSSSCSYRLPTLLKLNWANNSALAIRYISRAVHRLHSGVG